MKTDIIAASRFCLDLVMKPGLRSSVGVIVVPDTEVPRKVARQYAINNDLQYYPEGGGVVLGSQFLGQYVVCHAPTDPNLRERLMGILAQRMVVVVPEDDEGLNEIARNMLTGPESLLIHV